MSLKKITSSIFLVIILLLIGVFTIPSINALATTTTSTNSNVVSLSNPLGKNVTVPIVIGRIISAVLGIVGSLALVMFIYGGITWMTAAGNEKNVTKGKNIVIWTVLGLAVIFLSYALVTFVLQAIKG